MKMDELQRQKLVRVIENAFANTPYPDDGNIGYGLGKLEGQKWESLPVDIIRLKRDDFHNLLPKAFRYFLPALMRAVVVNPDVVDTFVDNILNLLSPNSMSGNLNEQMKERLDQRRQLFTDEEKKAVHAFLKSYFELEPEIERTAKEKQTLSAAIDYWS